MDEEKVMEEIVEQMLDDGPEGVVYCTETYGKERCDRAAQRCLYGRDNFRALRLAVLLKRRTLVQTYANMIISGKAPEHEKTYAWQFATVTSEGRLKRNLEERR